MREWLFRPLSPFASGVVVAAFAIATWVLVVVPLWKGCRSRLIQLSRNRLFLRRLGYVAIAIFVFALGLWVGWQKDEISARLRRGTRDLTRAIPSPSPAVAALNTPPPAIVDQLLREGKEFRERGDTTNALARFQEALDSQPDNTGVLQEMAQTYESMQMFDRANDVWRRIKQISPSDSPTYALANRRLKVGVPAAPIVEPGGTPAETDVPARRDVGGNADGPIMGISDVKTKETSDPEAETNLALEIGIKKQPGAVIDHNKVTIQVFLYDVVNDKDIKLTNANVSNEWLTPKHDWSDTNPEVLLVRYVRAKTGGALSESALLEAAAKVRPGQTGRGSKGFADIGQRKYLGYIVRVYYGNDLQAVQAEPARLLQQFPPFKHSTVADSRSKFEQSQQAFRQRDFATALKLVDEADKTDPNRPTTLNLRGEILMQQGQFDDAEPAFRKAAKLDPKLRDAQYNLAQIPFKKKEYAKARDRLETLYKRIPGGDKNPASELIKFKIYMTLLMEGKESRAHSMMEEFQFTSDTPALYYAQAAWEYKHNNPRKAEEWTNSANQIYSPALNGVFADAFYDVGWLQRPEITSTGQPDLGSSANAAPSEFAKYAMSLREQEMEKIPPLNEPTTSHVMSRYPWKTNIVTTVFWIGKKRNHRSVWDANWTRNYGGFDNPDPSARRNYIPVAFIPRQNPFYCALPYNDVEHGQFKPEAPLVIPWFKQSYTGPGQSVSRHRWIAIRKGDRLCYAQWEDCGPFRTDHFQYVFGNERPKPNANHGAGLNVSPAVRDYLGLAPTDVTDWQFVEVRDVPPGPWRSYGDNNHFVIARRQSEQRVGAADEWEKGKQPQP